MLCRPGRGQGRSPSRAAAPPATRRGSPCSAPGGRWQVVHFSHGYKLGLVRCGRDLVETEPVYRPNDPNCCPSGGFAHILWHWNGSRLASARHWHDRSPEG